MATPIEIPVKYVTPRFFQELVAELVSIFKTNSHDWDKAVSAWSRRVKWAAELDDRDRTLLLDLQHQLFE